MFDDRALLWKQTAEIVRQGACHPENPGAKQIRLSHVGVCRKRTRHVVALGRPGGTGWTRALGRVLSRVPCHIDTATECRAFGDGDGW